MPNGKRRLISVVMGTGSREARASESQKLLNWGWQGWDAVRLFEADKPVVTVPVWKGKLPEARYDERTSALSRSLGELTGPTIGVLAYGEVDQLPANPGSLCPVLSPVR